MVTFTSTTTTTHRRSRSTSSVASFCLPSSSSSSKTRSSPTESPSTSTTTTSTGRMLRQLYPSRSIDASSSSLAEGGGAGATRNFKTRGNTVVGGLFQRRKASARSRQQQGGKGVEQEEEEEKDEQPLLIGLPPRPSMKSGGVGVGARLSGGEGRSGGSSSSGGSSFLRWENKSSFDSGRSALIFNGVEGRHWTREDEEGGVTGDRRRQSVAEELLSPTRSINYDGTTTVEGLPPLVPPHRSTSFPDLQNAIGSRARVQTYAIRQRASSESEVVNFSLPSRGFLESRSGRSSPASSYPPPPSILIPPPPSSTSRRPSIPLNDIILDSQPLPSISRSIPPKRPTRSTSLNNLNSNLFPTVGAGARMIVPPRLESLPATTHQQMVENKNRYSEASLVSTTSTDDSSHTIRPTQTQTMARLPVEEVREESVGNLVESSRSADTLSVSPGETRREEATTSSGTEFDLRTTTIAPATSSPPTVDQLVSPLSFPSDAESTLQTSTSTSFDHPSTLTHTSIELEHLPWSLSRAPSLAFPRPPPISRSSSLPHLHLPSLPSLVSEPALSHTPLPPQTIPPLRPSPSSLSTRRPSLTPVSELLSTAFPPPNPPTENNQSWRTVPISSAKLALPPSELQKVVLDAIRGNSKEEGRLVVEGWEGVEKELEEKKEMLVGLREELEREKEVRKAMLVRHVVTLRGFNGDEGARFAEMLVGAVARPERIAMELDQVTSQIASLELLRESHWRSATTLSLAKLNTSFIKSREREKEMKIELERTRKERDQMVDKLKRLEGIFEGLGDGEGRVRVVGAGASGSGEESGKGERLSMPRSVVSSPTATMAEERRTVEFDLVDLRPDFTTTSVQPSPTFIRNNSNGVSPSSSSPSSFRPSPTSSAPRSHSPVTPPTTTIRTDSPIPLPAPSTTTRHLHPPTSPFTFPRPAPSTPPRLPLPTTPSSSSLYDHSPTIPHHHHISSPPTSTRRKPSLTDIVRSFAKSSLRASPSTDSLHDVSASRSSTPLPEIYPSHSHSHRHHRLQSSTSDLVETLSITTSGLLEEGVGGRQKHLRSITLDEVSIAVIDELLKEELRGADGDGDGEERWERGGGRG